MPKRKQNPIKRLEERLGRTLTEKEANEAIRIANRELSDRFDEKVKVMGVSHSPTYKKFKPTIMSLIERESKKHFGTTNKNFQEMLRLNIMQLIKKGEIPFDTTPETLEKVMKKLAEHVKTEYTLLVEELGLPLRTIKLSTTRFNVYEIQEIVNKAKEYNAQVAKTVARRVLIGPYPSIDEAIRIHKQITQEVLEAAETDKGLPTGIIISQAFQRKTSAQEQINRYKQLLEEAKEKGINQNNLLTVVTEAFLGNRTIEDGLKNYEKRLERARASPRRTRNPEKRKRTSLPENIRTVIEAPTSIAKKTPKEKTPKKIENSAVRKAVNAGFTRQQINANLEALRGWGLSEADIRQMPALLTIAPWQRQQLERMKNDKRKFETNLKKLKDWAKRIKI